jgi:hypothetical protein
MPTFHISTPISIAAGCWFMPDVAAHQIQFSPETSNLTKLLMTCMIYVILVAAVSGFPTRRSQLSSICTCTCPLPGRVVLPPLCCVTSWASKSFDRGSYARVRRLDWPVSTCESAVSFLFHVLHIHLADSFLLSMINDKRICRSRD